MEENTHTVLEAPAQSSVELEENAKGEVKIKVKAYASSITDAAIEALHTYYRTRAVVELSKNTQNDPVQMIMEQFEIPEEEG